MRTLLLGVLFVIALISYVIVLFKYVKPYCIWKYGVKRTRALAYTIFILLTYFCYINYGLASFTTLIWIFNLCTFPAWWRLIDRQEEWNKWRESNE